MMTRAPAFVVLDCELIAEEQFIDRGVRRVDLGRHHHPLAGGQPVRLHHDRRTALIDVGVRRRGVGEGAIGGGRNAMAPHERLGEILGTLEPGGGARRPEDPQAGGAKRVDDARGERAFRADDGQTNLLGARKVGQFRDRAERDVGEFGLEGGAGIAGSDKDLGHARRARNPPRQGVLAAAAADDEYVQRTAFT